MPTKARSCDSDHHQSGCLISVETGVSETADHETSEFF